MNDRPLGCSVFYSTLLPYGFTSKLFTFLRPIELCVCIFVNKINNQLKKLGIIDFYRQIKLVDWQLSTDIEYYRLIDCVFDDRLWSTSNVLVKWVFVESCICDIDQLVICATKNNDLVFEFRGEGCHRTAKSQDN